MYSARQRRALLVRLSRYGDDDGTNCWPGEKLLATDEVISERQVRRFLADLKDLGFVHDDGYHHNPKNPKVKNKKWKLMLPPAAQKALGLIDDLPEIEFPAAEAAAS